MLKIERAKGSRNLGCGGAMVESKIKGAAGFLLRLAAPSILMRQREF